MLKRQMLKDVTWIDLDSPTSDEVKQVMDEYSIHPLIAEDLLSPTERPRLQMYGNFIYLVLHFPALRHTNSRQENQEVDFVIGKNFVLTAHYDTIDPLHKFSKIFEVQSILEKTSAAEYSVDSATAGEHAHILFLALVRKLYRSVMHELEVTHDALQEVERHIFSGKEKQMVLEISKISRDLLTIKQSLAPHHDIFDQFREVSVGLFGEPSVHHVTMILREESRVEMLLRNAIEVLTELRETNNSLVSTKQNDVIQILTIMAFVTLPLGLIADIFSMNTSYVPFVGIPYDFWIVVGIMAIIGFCFFCFFRYKKWL